MGDTIKAINDYKLVGREFEVGFLGEAGMLYKKMGDEKNARLTFLDGAKAESEQYSMDGKMDKKYRIPIQQLSALELYIISENFQSAKAYSDSIRSDMKDSTLVPIYLYLIESLKIIDASKTDYATSIFPDTFKGKIAKNWGFSLFLEWLNLTKLPKNKVDQLRKLTLTVQSMQK